MPNMIYGTAWKKEETTRLVELAITSGFRAIDTACQPKHYREDLVGIALNNSFNKGIKRDELFIQTKFTPISGQDENNMPYLSSDDILTQLEKSFYTSKKNLNIDFIDSYLIHSPFGPIEDLVKVYRTMEEFVQAGEVGQIGISNCYDFKLLSYLYDIAKIKPKVVQNRFYSESSYDKEIRAFCKQKDITYQSFWSLTANPNILKSNEVQNLAKKYEKTAEQVFYKFLNEIEITPLNGSTSQIHMIEDLDIKSFSLESYEVDSISNLL
ncbi:aldo/keto reductase family protein [Poseidonibacter ostreae]|mgnify:CR=1 FL=1|jgi:diketogulonate reductase-like aldo/keto reductase|uniref:Aldo/keto reductase n=1 Tax=Poseidonibacter ostreae TaxID=2654171 RepID=A0A6L4WUN8_9BACT|nr:aldo/keto reductase [Poseidonibacter ostreae]KAB7887065.1 aldo/keto reductase [Poseidonibacter ostreae]KAB7889211.1 aldo/keto reductase [Poseidonibacter ostreae]KAB7891588.1 aldo/keto reductase [Poseidonibacter ostreae]MAC84813.1 aldo/keto reductase [Arcobacter sp.]|tara:strand:- start:606 stop:1409 length:804 start_codon:yes stop_codon:yes gene_type:complete